MEKKRGFSDKLDSFFAGKGFYIVLFLCVAIIGVSAWIMFGGKGTSVDGDGDSQISVPQETLALSDDSYLWENYNPDENTAAANNIPDDDAQPEEPVISQSEPEDVPTIADPPSFVWPVNGDVERPYSVDRLIYDRTMADWRTHSGIDLASELGTQVLAIASGSVESVYSDDLLGTTVIIDHGNGLKSCYSNLAAMPTVKSGDQVTAGTIIGSVGDTAICETGEGTHLHFAITLNGASVNPTDYLT